MYINTLVYGGDAYYTSARFSPIGALSASGLTLEFQPPSSGIQETKLVQLVIFGAGTLAELTSPEAQANLAAFTASPFMAAVRAKYIKGICEPFASLKPYSCTRSVVQRRPPLVRARSLARIQHTTRPQPLTRSL